LTGCLALPNTGVFLGLAGKETADVCLKANDLTEAKEAIRISEEAPKAAIRD
jgi:cation transport ATPase